VRSNEAFVKALVSIPRLWIKDRLVGILLKAKFPAENVLSLGRGKLERSSLALILDLQDSVYLLSKT
jgi:hypothetical protein